MVGKARGQRQPAQQNQQAHQHHQQAEAALTGLRHHRRQPGQHAGADILQAAHQRPGGSGEERERLHRAAGGQREQHPGAEEEQRRRHQQGPDGHDAQQPWDPHHQTRQQAADHRLPHQGRETLVGAAGKPRPEERRRDRQNKQNTHRHAAQAEHRAHQHPGAGFEYRNPRQAADQHQQIAVKGAGAEQRFVAGQKFGARRPFRARFRHPLRHAEGHPGAQDQQESVAGAPAPQGVEDAAEQRGNQRADQNTHI